MSDQSKPDFTPVSLDDVLITAELSARPARPPDYEAENRALSTLAQAMASSHDSVLQKLAATILGLCRADSAGVSILEPGGESGLFRWHAIAGAFAANAQGTIARELSPCGMVLDRNSVLLFAHPERHFPYPVAVDPPFVEMLLAPFHVSGEPVGTMWAIAHTPEKKFDAEDARRLQSLSRFASVAYQMTAALRAEREARTELERRVRERMAEVAAARAFAENIVDTMRNPLLVLDSDLLVVSANQEFYRAFRVSRAETEGRLVYELGNRQWNIPRLRTLLEEILPRDTTFRDFEVEHHFEHIGRKVMLLNARRLRRGPGEPEMILLAVEDVTERRNAEEARREAETRFTEMVKNVRDHCIFLMDAEGVITSWNVAAERIIGYTEEEAVGRHFSFIFPLEDVRAGLPDGELRKAQEQGRAEDERWHVKKGGERFWALGIVTPRRDDRGSLIGFSKILRDMTESKRAEEALRQSEAMLTRELEGAKQLQTVSGLLVQEANAEALYEQILDAAVAIMHADMGSIQMLDAERNELRLLAWRGFHPESAAYWAKVTPQTATSCGSVLRVGQRLIIPDANEWEPLQGTESLRHYHLCGSTTVQSTPLVTRAGRLVGMISTHWRSRHEPGERELRLLDVLARQAADALERARATAALRESEARLRLALGAARMGTWSWEVAADRHRRDGNLNRLLGLKPAETVLPIETFFEHIHLDDRAAVREAFDASVREGQNLRVDFRIVWPDGEVRWLRDQGDVFGGVAEHYLAGACMDITDRIRLEEELRRARDELELRVQERTAELRESQSRVLQAERLAIIGQTMTVLAHEGRNVLQRADGTLARLTFRLEGRPDDLALVGRARLALDDLRRLFEDIRTYAAPIRLDTRRCDLRRVWREAWDQVSEQRPDRDARLEEVLEETAAECEADPFRLVLVFANLFTNALDACPDPMRVALSCQEVRLGDRPAVRIVLRDNGPGFTPEQRQQALEPFFTTKPKGTGLGLAIARRIVEAHGGVLAIEESDGPGATLSLTLPRWRDGAGAP